MNIEKAKLEDLVSPEWNPRQITDDELEKLRVSLEEFGYIEPIIVNDVNMHIVGGNQRAKALQTLGYTEVDVVYVHIEDIAKEKACNVALNKISGDWDTDKLKVVLEEIELSPIDINLTGFDEIELTEFDIEPIQHDNNDQTTEDKYPDYDMEKTPTNIQYGEIYQLGKHRLMCGDSCNKEDVNKLMNNNFAKILFTSPPYSDMRDYNEGTENLTITRLKEFIKTYQPYTNYQCVNLGIQQKNKEVFCYWNDYIDYAREIGYKLLSWNVWDKIYPGAIGQQNRFFPLSHEWIFVFGTEPYELNKTIPKKEESINKKRSKTQRRNVDGSLRFSSQGDTSNPYKKMGSVISLIYECGDIRSKHPATFPVALPSEYIKAMTNEEDIIIDCFGGSGTTMIACEQLNRKCYMMELSPEYCQVIINRWEDFTGGKAVKIN